AVAYRSAGKSMCIDRRLDVPGARATWDRWALPGVDPIADLEAAAAGQEADVGTPDSEGLADHRLPLDGRRPSPRGHHKHAPARACGQPVGLTREAPRLSLLRCSRHLSQPEMHALHHVLAQAVARGERAHR